MMYAELPMPIMASSVDNEHVARKQRQQKLDKSKMLRLAYNNCVLVYHKAMNVHNPCLRIHSLRLPTVA